MISSNKFLSNLYKDKLKSLQVFKASQELRLNIKNNLVYELSDLKLPAKRLWFYRPVFIVIIVLIALLFAGSGLVTAAQSSKPGDFLYPVKKVKEQIQLRLTNDSYTRLRVHENIASERLFELEEVVDDNVDIEETIDLTTQYKNEISKADEEMAQIEVENKNIKIEYKETLDNHTDKLTEIKENADAKVAPIIEETLQIISEEAVEIELQLTPTPTITPTPKLDVLLELDLQAPVPTLPVVKKVLPTLGVDLKIGL